MNPFLDVGDGLPGVQVLGASLGAVHDRVTPGSARCGAVVLGEGVGGGEGRQYRRTYPFTAVPKRWYPLFI